MDEKIFQRLRLIFILLPILIFPWNYDFFYRIKFTFLAIIWILIIYDLIVEVIKSKKISIPVNALLIPPLLILFTWIVATIFSLNKYMAILGAFGRYDGLLAIVIYTSLYIIIASYVHSKEKIEKLVFWLLISSTLVAFLGIIQVLMAGTFKPPINLDPARAFSTVGNSVFFGGFLVIVFPLFCYRFYREAELKNKMIVAIAGIVVIISILLTSSRGAFIGMGTAIAIFIFLQLLRRGISLKKFLVTFLILIIVLSSIVMLFKPLKNRIFSIVDLENPTVLSRLLIYKGAVGIIYKFPLFGVGPDNFGNAFGEFRPSEWNIKVTQIGPVDKAHNDFLQYATTTGIAGLLAYIFFIVTILLFSVKQWKTSEDSTKLLLSGLIASFIGYIAQAQFSFATVAVTPFWWVIAALVASLNNSNHLEFKLELISNRLKKLKIVLEIMVILLMLSFFGWWYADVMFYTGQVTVIGGGDYQQAKTYFNINNRLNFYEFQYPFLIGNIYFHAARRGTAEQNIYLDDSITQLNKAIRLNIYSADIYRRRGDAYMLGDQLGRENYLQLAISDYRKSIDLDPFMPLAWQGLGSALIRSKNMSRGKMAWENALSLYQDDYYKEYIESLYLIELGREDDARELLEKILHDKKGFYEAHITLQELNKK